MLIGLMSTIRVSKRAGLENGLVRSWCRGMRSELSPFANFGLRPISRRRGALKEAEEEEEWTAVVVVLVVVVVVVVLAVFRTRLSEVRVTGSDNCQVTWSLPRTNLGKAAWQKPARSCDHASLRKPIPDRQNIMTCLSKTLTTTPRYWNSLDLQDHRRSHATQLEWCSSKMHYSGTQSVRVALGRKPN